MASRGTRKVLSFLYFVEENYYKLAIDHKIIEDQDSNKEGRTGREETIRLRSSRTLPAPPLAARPVERNPKASSARRSSPI
ncbi:hypothetical protein M5K25_025981 [Dendrobium thyrsiflorum]|uniref:Uncharacterized protein n=1 Tax=Dendrobium thyrsiflorum TaxID=117978 RepID=A0ABD0TWB4_DENTH